MFEHLPKNIKDLINYFSDLKEGFIILNAEDNIIYSNSEAKLYLKNTKNIRANGYLFSFDICVLEDQNIVNYNPIEAALNSNNTYKAEVNYQLEREIYKKILLKSIKQDGFTLLFISDAFLYKENIELKIKNNIYLEKINTLKNKNIELYENKSQIQNQVIKGKLLNTAAISIREYLDTNKIIHTILDEMSHTFSLSKSVYLDKDLHFIMSVPENISKDFSKDIVIKEVLSSKKSKSSMEHDTKENLDIITSGDLTPRLTVPIIYQNKIQGIFVLYLTKSSRNWHEDEIDLIDNIASQLGIAINQIDLFNEIEEKKQTLENTLTKLKQTQTQLIQSEKMASLGQLVAGVAHEINTPMGAINNNHSILKSCIKKLDKEDKVINVLQNISKINEEAIKRIKNIVESLRNFSRIDEAELKEVDIKESIKSTLMLIKHQLKERIEIVEDYDSIPMITCYPNLLNQVFMNILVNAYQSIDGKGIIKIKATTDNTNVRVVISDTGKGISEENLQKIFDPGYTTKGVGVGTGLGLSICYQIMEKQHGRILVDSNLGIGTTFTLVIPKKLK